MADKPRLKLPKQAKKGEIIQIKTLVQHPMETGFRRDMNGRAIGSPEIDRAAALIAQSMRDAGLEPAGNAPGSFDQGFSASTPYSSATDAISRRQ